MTIYIATDHAGFELKKLVCDWLSREHFDIVDYGAFSYDAEDDFPDFIYQVGQAISTGEGYVRGIIFGGSGQGEAMIANRYPNVRAAVYYGGDESIVRLSREHNDANVLSIGARFVDGNTVKRVIWDWLHTEALAEAKYHRRNRKIEELTKQSNS
jgi:ribose 5-phosphate isomerase B